MKRKNVKSKKEYQIHKHERIFKNKIFCLYIFLLITCYNLQTKEMENNNNNNIPSVFPPSGVWGG